MLIDVVLSRQSSLNVEARSN